VPGIYDTPASSAVRKNTALFISFGNRNHNILGPFYQPRPLFFPNGRLASLNSAFQLGAKVFVINANNPYGMVKK